MLFPNTYIMSQKSLLISNSILIHKHFRLVRFRFRSIHALNFKCNFEMTNAARISSFIYDYTPIIVGNVQISSQNASPSQIILKTSKTIQINNVLARLN